MPYHHSRPGEEKPSPADSLKWKEKNVVEKSSGLKNKINAMLLYLHHRFTEEGDPNHIITAKEAALALNIKDAVAFRSAIGSAYSKVHTLDDILESLGLPHNPPKQ